MFLLSFSLFLNNRLWAKNKNLLLLSVSWHEPSTFLACFYCLFGCTEHLSKYRMVQHCGQDWQKITFSFQSIPLHLLVNTRYCSFLRVARVGSRKEMILSCGFPKEKSNTVRPSEAARPGLVLWAGSPVTLGEPHSNGRQPSPVLWRQGSAVEGTQASAAPDWISCLDPY